MITLIESVVYNEYVPGSGHLRVVRNPSRTHFQGLLATFNQQEARGILTDDALYVWDSWVATHPEVESLLRIKGYQLVLNHVYVEFRGVGHVADDYSNTTEEDEQENAATADWLKTEPPLQRIYGPSPDVRVYEPE